jgi:predicted nucleic acid-binding protein
VLYLDSSALLKLVSTEPESVALNRWLADQPNLVHVSSSVIRAEVPRAIWRADPGALPDSYRVIRRVVEVELSDEVLSRAAGVRPQALRTIDAIHLASALTLRRELTAFVAYDKRLLAAAKDAGLPTASPA